MRGLYAIADVRALAARRCDPVAFAAAVLKARPAALQLRAKEATPHETLELLRAIAPLCRRAGVPLVANDHPELAKLAGCDLVHVGQRDIPVALARRLAPGIGLGVSTHDLPQLEAALDERPSYVAFGPVFETPSKRDSDPVVGPVLLRQAHDRARAAGVPLVAIGGISYERARGLVGDAEAFAVIGELLPRTVGDGGASLEDVLDEVSARARSFHELVALDLSHAEAVR
jgi:thiamine-phosphate pyrophosphorylase